MKRILGITVVVIIGAVILLRNPTGLWAFGEAVFNTLF